MSIYVTKSFLPDMSEYMAYVQGIYESGILTNQGPMVQELESKLKTFLGARYLHYVSNGTVALQLALRSFGITEGEIITTPFSYVATVSSILWERCKPVFVDIEQEYMTLDPAKVEAAITPQTKAIMPVHVFGYACAVDQLAEIARKHGLKLIYDGAHAFASVYKGRSLVSYGDAATLSFHATKLFHTIEGGACILRDGDVSDKLELIKRFGHQYDNHECLGINAKQSEFHAAMGLANFSHIGEIIEKRRCISERYDECLAGCVWRPKAQEGLEYNYAYYPVVFRSESELLRVMDALKKHDIYARRYFWPSLNTLPYVDKQSCPISEDISARVACLPLYPNLQHEVVEKICDIIRQNLRDC